MFRHSSAILVSQEEGSLFMASVSRDFEAYKSAMPLPILTRLFLTLCSRMEKSCFQFNCQTEGYTYICRNMEESGRY